MSKPFRVLVTGGRNYKNVSAVDAALDILLSQYGEALVIIEGGCPTGADRLARLWAKLNHVELITEKADWDKHGTAAGPIRNSKMVTEYQPSVVLAFPGNDGTADCVRKAERAGIRVIKVGED